MISFKKIKERVCKEFEITVEDFDGPSRVHLFVVARHRAWWLGRREGFTFTQLGRWSGGRDHSTIVHGVEMEEFRQSGQHGWYLKARAERYTKRTASTTPGIVKRDPVEHGLKLMAKMDKLKTENAKKERKVPAKVIAAQKPKLIKPVYRVG